MCPGRLPKTAECANKQPMNALMWVPNPRDFNGTGLLVVKLGSAAAPANTLPEHVCPVLLLPMLLPCCMSLLCKEPVTAAVALSVAGEHHRQRLTALEVTAGIDGDKTAERI